MARRCAQINEALLLALACLSPWAFGAVTAWAELALYLGVALSALLGAVSGWRMDRLRLLTCVPSLGLIGLVLVGVAQQVAWPRGIAAFVAPTSDAFMISIGRDRPGWILDDPMSRVVLPGKTISQNPEMTVDATTRLVAGWVLLQSVIGARLLPGASRRLGIALAANASLLSLFALVQMLSWNGRLYWILSPLEATARGGPFVNRNHLAAYLNLGLGYPLAALIDPGKEHSRKEDRGRRLWAAYAAGLILVGILASHSRGGVVATVVATAALLVLAMPRTMRVATGLAIMSAISVIFLWGVGASDSLRRLETLSEPNAFENRLICWRISLRAWWSCPVLGLGLGTFTNSTARFFDRDQPVVFMHAENEYLETLAEGGGLGLILIILILASVLRLGLSAASSTGHQGRLPILGALFGLVGLAIHCMVDFPMHVPSIAVTAAILAAHLVRAGLDAGASSVELSGPPPARLLSRLTVLAMAALALLATRHGVAMVRSEAALLGSGIPRAGTDVPTATLWFAPMSRLDRAREQLVEALRHRPNWAEGHARLGLVCLSQYRAEVAELIRDEALDVNEAERMADPLWLHKVIHSISPERLASSGGLLDHEPVRRHLVSAAHSFLEARRCCPVWGLPHAELASLDFLIGGDVSSPDHARRALSLAGTDLSTMAIAAKASAQAGDPRMAALGWRRMLEVNEGCWRLVADQARAALTPRQILDWALPDGRFAIRFAGRLYDTPAARPDRLMLLRWAVNRLPLDLELPEAERLGFEAQALDQLGLPETARERMLAALALEPLRYSWRKQLVGWLLSAGKIEEAHDQALIGLNLAPENEDARRAVVLTAEALAKGIIPRSDPSTR